MRSYVSLLREDQVVSSAKSPVAWEPLPPAKPPPWLLRAGVFERLQELRCHGVRVEPGLQMGGELVLGLWSQQRLLPAREVL